MAIKKRLHSAIKKARTISTRETSLQSLGYEGQDTVGVLADSSAETSVEAMNNIDSSRMSEIVRSNLTAEELQALSVTYDLGYADFEAAGEQSLRVSDQSALVASALSKLSNSMGTDELREMYDAS